MSQNARDAGCFLGPRASATTFFDVGPLLERCFVATGRQGESEGDER